MSHLFEQVRALYDEMRVTAPWVEWARKNPVEFHLSDYAPPDAVYLLTPVMFPTYRVIASTPAWRQLRAKMRVDNEPLGPMSDRALAELVAWHLAPLKEPHE